MEQDLWYRMREHQRSAGSAPRCDPLPAPTRAHRVEQSRRMVGRAVVRVGELIAAERYVPATRQARALLHAGMVNAEETTLIR